MTQSADRDVAPASPRDAASVWTDAGLLLMVAIWAVNFSVIKAALDAFSPLVFNALRFPIASLTVFLVLRLQGPLPRPDRRDLGRLVLLGLIGNVVYQLFFIFGMDRTRAGNASLLLATTPIFTALGSAAAGHERMEGRLWGGAAATLLGMALVIAGGSEAMGLGADTLVGDLLMVGASVIWSVYTVGGRDLVGRYGSIPVTAWTLWVGTAGIVALGLPGLAAVEWSAVPPAAWAGVLYAGGLGIGLAYLLWYRGVQHIGSTRTATYSNLVPVFALLVAWPLLGEVPTAGQLVGAAVIIGGITLARSRR